jgi:hypothetical protein
MSTGSSQMNSHEVMYVPTKINDDWLAERCVDPRAKFTTVVQRACVVAPSSIQDVDETLQHIPSVASFLHSCRVNLLSRRNALVPINQLSNDLLVHIFHLCSSTWDFLHPPNETEEEYEFPKTVLAFSQVCRSWREIALSTPSLWRTPIFDWGNVDVLPWEMIRRAAKCPLIITSHIQDLNLASVQSALDRNLSRTSYVELAAAPQHMADLIGSLIDKPADILRALGLYIISSNADPIRSSFSVDPLIFAGQAPCLRTLQLEGCTLHWSSMFFPNVTTLDIDLHKVSTRMTLSDVVETLRRTPLLQNLGLREVCDVSVLSDLSEVQEYSIILSFMEDLVLGDLPSLMIPLLRQLAIPSGSCIAYYNPWGYIDPMTIQLLEDLGRYLYEHCRKGPPLHYLRLESPSPASACLQGHISEVPKDDQFQYTESEARLMITLVSLVSPADGLHVSLEDFIRVISARLPLGDLVVLDLQGPQTAGEAATGDIMHLLSKLSSLRCLRAECTFVPPVVHALTSKPSEGSVLLPVLALVHLRDALLLDTLHSDAVLDGTTAPLRHWIDVQDLAHMLYARRTAGSAIEKLVLSKCSLKPNVCAKDDEVRSFITPHLRHEVETTNVNVQSESLSSE